MTKLNRRLLLASVATASLVPQAFGQETAKPDPAKLNAAPAIGEMAQGAETAKVTVIEYASASCPHCANFFKDVYVPLKKDYIDTGKVRFILREFPHNDLGLAAFMLARCAPKEKYFPMVDIFFEKQQDWMADPVNKLKDIYKQAGLTDADFDACLKNETVAKGILEVKTKGEELGVDSIPTIYVNGERYEGARTYDEFKKKIDPLLAG
jgi:protein-disulfide isomerase